MMKRPSYRLIKPCLLIALSLLLITACSQSGSRSPHLPLTPASECRVIQHEFGETCVPLHPQRIVALHPAFTLDPSLALGIKPIGYTSDRVGGKEIIGSVSLDDVAGATNVGKPFEPSLEKILLLKPDLILTSHYSPHPSQYQLLSAIAPTVQVPFDSLANEALFKQTLRYVANVFGEKAKAEEILSQYQKRIEEFRQRLGNQLEQIEISVIYYNMGLVYTPMVNGDASADVLRDTGLHYKLPHPGAPMSIESLDEYNADILFIISDEQRPPSFYKQHPLFSHLKAVKNNRAYPVSPDRWDTPSILGANRVLDDLFKYLLEDG
jgi:iron complex transport system substrate-binding protein